MMTTGTSDLSRLFLSTGHSARIKSELSRHTVELSTGQLADPATRLGAGLTRLSDIDRQSARTAGFSQAALQTAQALSTMQTALSSLDAARGRTQATTLQLAGIASPLRTEAAATSARADLATMLGALNTRSGDLTLFAGRATDGPAVAPTAQVLADLRLSLAGASSVADVEARIDAWFGPGGGFETAGYLGDTGAPLTRRVDDTTVITAPVRADDPALRRVLAATALAGLADDPGMTLTDAQRQDLFLRAGERLLESAEGIVHLRANLGAAEARLDVVMSDQSARKTALGLMRSELVAADPFEAATRLRAVQNQLETHYALTARLSRLSLADYL